MKLVIDDWRIRLSDNSWLDKKIFNGCNEYNEYIFVYRFKKCIIIQGGFGDKLSLFVKFGGFRSSYIGLPCIKIMLDNKNIEFKA